MTMIKRFFILVLSLLCSGAHAVAQKNDKLLEVYFSEVRANKFPVIPKQLTIAENARHTLDQITPYLHDTVLNVRAKAYTIVNLAGNNSRQNDVRADAVLKLIAGAIDQNAGNAGLALDYLSNFLSTDFNAVAKDSLGSLFTHRPYHFAKIIRLTGFAGLTNLINQIRPLTQPGNPQQVRWSAILALARMGDPSAIANMMTRVKKLPVSDDVVYQIFPDLIYTKNREAFNYMIEVMASDEKNCLSADAENEQPIPCGYRIMELLAAAIKNYPLALDKSGDIKSDDYLRSLAAVRYWFSQNSNYEIIVERY